jgi:hypothetical protein
MDVHDTNLYVCQRITHIHVASVKLYTLIYVLLLGLALSKVAFFEFFGYWKAVSATLVTATMKTLLIVGYYQHLKFEPRSLTYLMGMGVFAVFLLTVAATYSMF